MPNRNAWRAASLEPLWAVTLMPLRCATSMSVDISSSVIGAAEMLPRGSEMPPDMAILIQSAPLLICSRTTCANPSGPSASMETWPPVGMMTSPAVLMRGPTTSPLSMALRSAKSVPWSSPTNRSVVTPESSERRSSPSIRSPSSVSVSKASESPAAPGSFRPRCTCAFVSPGISHRPVMAMTLAPGGMGVEFAGPICEMRSPTINTVASLSAGPPSIPTTVPPTKAVTAGAAGGAAEAEAEAARMAKTTLKAAKLAAAIKENRLDDMVWLLAPFDSLCRKTVFLMQVVFHDTAVAAGTVALQRIDIPVRTLALPQQCLDCLLVGSVQAQIGDFAVGSQVRGIARAADGGGHMIPVQHRPRRHRRDVTAVLDCNPPQDLQELLEQFPAAEIVDDQFVFDQGSIGQIAGWFAPSHPSLRQKSAGDLPVADDADIPLAAQIDHAVSGPLVEQRILRLNRDHRYAGIENFREAGHVEVGHADVGDFPFVAQPGERRSRFHIAGNFVVPPMELHQVQALHPQAHEGTID